MDSGFLLRVQSINSLSSTGRDSKTSLSATKSMSVSSSSGATLSSSGKTGAAYRHVTIYSCCSVNKWTEAEVSEVTRHENHFLYLQLSAADVSVPSR